MQNKINVAELLRKCPEGMELDCTLFSKPLKYSGFEGFKDDYLIRTVAENGEIFWFTKEGCIHNNMYSKCVIFPKGKTSWEGFVPPYPFKDGDICYIKTKDNEHIFIFNCIDNYGIKRYANLTKHGFYKDDVNIVCTEKVIEEFRYATEEEKDRLFKSIKNHGYMWNPEKKCLEKLPRFKNGDVIVGKESTGSYIAIVKEFTNSNSFTTHMFLTSFGTNIAGLNNSNPRLATEKEKQKLFNALRKNNYEWNSKEKCLEPLVIKPKFKVGDEIKFSCRGNIFIVTAVNDKYYCLAEKGSTITFPALISSDKDWELVPNKFDITTLKRFDKVLVRHCSTDEWDIDFFGYYSRGFYHATGKGLYKQCIPYIGNEHIAGTSVDCDDYYKNW